MLRLMKYPGAKTNLIPDIRSIFKKSKCSTFVDVFGGSGTVSLNLNATRTVYNDADADLANIFTSLQKNPSIFKRMLREATASGRLVNPLVSGNFSDPDVQRRFNAEVKAFSTVYRFTVSFGGLGETYGTKEKSAYPYAVKTLEQFPAIVREISSWIIENLDFQALMQKYDSTDSFFYLDPPYSGKKWYRHNLERRDYARLGETLSSLKGFYLLNLDMEDSGALSVLGTPDFVRAYENRNAYPGRGQPRMKGFYTNISD